MKTKGKNLQAIVSLALLPLVATAAVSAQQWISDRAPIGTGVKQDVVEAKTFISHRMHKIALNRSGAVEGRIANMNPETLAVEGVANMQIYFIDNGQVVSETKTRSDGTFLVSGLVEGAYSFIATGEEGFAAYGVKVVAEGTVDAKSVMEAATVSPNLKAVQQILNQQLPSRVADEIVQLADLSYDRAVGANRVRLENGTLNGRLSLVKGDNVEGTQIDLLKDEVSVAQFRVGKDGSFSIDNLSPGVYQFVAFGSAGFAAISFEAIDFADVADTDEINVAVQPLVADSDYLDVTLAAAQDAIFDAGGGFNDRDRDRGFVIGDSFGSGAGFGGGAGGGGGGLFGGGGFGRFLLLGGAAAAIAIPLASGDSDPPPTTPTMPE